MQKSSVNKVILVGHTGNKPEGRYTTSGVSTASFSLATNESWLNNENEKKEHTEGHSIVAWNKLADFVTEYIQKGQLLYIEGKLQTRTYKDKDDVQHWKTEIIANSITPLEWKTADQKNNETNKITNSTIEGDNIAEDKKEQELPF